MNVTSKQIAELAGVSRGTVDRVLHDRDGVNPQVRKRVWEICERLGYRPNIVGRQLAAIRSGTKFGLVLPQERNRAGFWTIVRQGISAAISDLEDYAIRVLQREYLTRTDDELIQHIDSLLSEGIAGLVIAPTNGPAVQKKLNEVIDTGLPVVLVNTECENVQPLCYVGVDYGINGRTAAGLMTMLSHPRPIKLIIFTGSSNVLAHTARVSSFLGELERSGAAYELVDTGKIYTARDANSKEESYQRCYDMLFRHPETTAVLTAAGMVELSAKAILDLDIADRVTHIGFDLTPLTYACLQNGSLTAVICQEAFRQGKESLKLLFDFVINGKTPDKKRYLLNNEIFIRHNASENVFSRDSVQRL